MGRILIPLFVAALTTYGCHLWWERQWKAEGAQRQRADWLNWLMAAMYAVWTAMMAVLVWVGFFDPVRSLDAYPFERLGVSVLVGLAFVAAGGVMGVLAAIAHGDGKTLRKPMWRRLSPMGCQFLFIMFSGLMFQHSCWGGPP